jgi:hypothetical protein
MIYCRTNGSPIVIVVLFHAKNTWRWEGTYERLMKLKLPTFKEKSMLLIYVPEFL